jgi:hypothetical protein
MGSRRNTRRVTGARPGGFILIQRCTTHDRLRFRGPQHHAPQSGTRRVPALRFRGIMKPFSALSSKLKIIRATASAHSSTSSALPSVATKIDQYPYASLRLRSNVVIGNTRAGRVPPPPQPCFARVLPINAKGFTGLDPRTEMCRIQLFNASALIAGHSPRSVRNPRLHRRGGMGELYRDCDTKLKRDSRSETRRIVRLPSRGRTLIFRPTACGYPRGRLRSPPPRKRASFIPGAFSTIPI